MGVTLAIAALATLVAARTANDGIARATAPTTYDGLPPGPRLAGASAHEGPPLQVPWMCGQTESCTQGHNTGSHTGQSAWAWDLVLQVGEEIWAASAGTVTHVRMDSNSGGCDVAYINDANYVTIDHGDGTSISYVHMQTNSSPLKVGDEVEIGDLVGHVGQTGYACGAHLHLQVMETCGAYYCQSVPASFADYGDLAAGMQYQGTNCPVCAIELAGGVTEIDDQDAGCFVRETTSWWSSFSGENGHHFYTIATDAAMDASTGSWLFVVTTPGDYLVEVFVPDTDADSTNARYQVVSADGTMEVAIDQTMQKGWQELGVFTFMGGADERVRLGDATGENLDMLMRRLGYDAVRFTFVPAGGTTSGGLDTTSASETGGDAGSGDGGSLSSTGGGTTSASGADTSGGDDHGLPPGWGQDPTMDEGGCACTSSTSPRGLGWLVLLLAFTPPLQRRRRLARTFPAWTRVILSPKTRCCRCRAGDRRRCARSRPCCSPAPQRCSPPSPGPSPRVG